MAKTDQPILKRMIRRKDVERKTGLSRTTIYRLMSINKFPRCVRIGIRAVAWDEQEIDGWMQAQKDQVSMLFNT